jgi:hypothetical protein
MGAPWPWSTYIRKCMISCIRGARKARRSPSCNPALQDIPIPAVVNLTSSMMMPECGECECPAFIDELINIASWLELEIACCWSEKREKTRFGFPIRESFTRASARSVCRPDFKIKTAWFKENRNTSTLEAARVPGETYQLCSLRFTCEFQLISHYLLRHTRSQFWLIEMKGLITKTSVFFSVSEVSYSDSI